MRLDTGRGCPNETWVINPRRGHGSRGGDHIRGHQAEEGGLFTGAWVHGCDKPCAVECRRPRSLSESGRAMLCAQVHPTANLVFFPLWDLQGFANRGPTLQGLPVAPGRREGRTCPAVSSTLSLSLPFLHQMAASCLGMESLSGHPG